MTIEDDRSSLTMIPRCVLLSPVSFPRVACVFDDDGDGIMLDRCYLILNDSPCEERERERETNLILILSLEFLCSLADIRL